MNILEQLYNEKKTRRERIAFRIDVCVMCGWSTSQTFYNKINGKTPLSKLEIEAIHKIK